MSIDMAIDAPGAETAREEDVHRHLLGIQSLCEYTSAGLHERGECWNALTGAISLLALIADSLEAAVRESRRHQSGAATIQMVNALTDSLGRDLDWVMGHAHRARPEQIRQKLERGLQSATDAVMILRLSAEPAAVPKKTRTRVSQ